MTGSIQSSVKSYTTRFEAGGQYVRRREQSPHLRALEAESIHIMREVVAEFDHPVMLYSIGKDSAVMLHLALKAFYPSALPFPLQHVDTTYKFREMIEFRDALTEALGLEMRVEINEDGLARGITPFEHGSQLHTQVMKTEALRNAMERHGYDAAFGGARRDEEKSRAKERVFSFRDSQQGWDPKNQRPELWRNYNTRITKGDHSISVVSFHRKTAFSPFLFYLGTLL